MFHLYVFFFLQTPAHPSGTDTVSSNRFSAALPLVIWPLQSRCWLYERVIVSNARCWSIGGCSHLMTFRELQRKWNFLYNGLTQERNCAQKRSDVNTKIKKPKFKIFESLSLLRVPLQNNSSLFLSGWKAFETFRSSRGSMFHTGGLAAAL